jgi:hypothetical protein
LLRCLAGLTDDCLRPGDPAVQFWGRMQRSDFQLCPVVFHASVSVNAVPARQTVLTRDVREWEVVTVIGFRPENLGDSTSCQA